MICKTCGDIEDHFHNETRHEKQESVCNFCSKTLEESKQIWRHKDCETCERFISKQCTGKLVISNCWFYNANQQII